MLPVGLLEPTGGQPVKAKGPGRSDACLSPLELKIRIRAPNLLTMNSRCLQHDGYELPRRSIPALKVQGASRTPFDQDDLYINNPRSRLLTGQALPKGANSFVNLGLTY